HDVELVQARVDGREQRRDDREVLRDVVGDGERRQRAPGDEQLLADLDDLDELGRVGVATSFPPACSRLMRAILSSGVASARKSSTPASSAIAFAVSGLSPVIMTVLMPMRRSSSNRSRMPSLTTSFRWMTPRTRAPSESSIATSSGVPPVADSRRSTGHPWAPSAGGAAGPHTARRQSPTRGDTVVRPGSVLLTRRIGVPPLPSRTPSCRPTETRCAVWNGLTPL
ncbi:hypothetical protein STRIP9103_00163, partial [Streptomyces ipomoeae 91-03]